MNSKGRKGRNGNRTAERSLRVMGSLACAAVFVACGGGSGDGASPSSEPLHGTIGAEGGELVGASGTALAGVHLVVPRGRAQRRAPTITIRPAATPRRCRRPRSRCGPMFAIEPAGLALAAPASLTLPFDESDGERSEPLRRRGQGVGQERHRLGPEPADRQQPRAWSRSISTLRDRGGRREPAGDRRTSSPSASRPTRSSRAASRSIPDDPSPPAQRAGDRRAR